MSEWGPDSKALFVKTRHAFAPTTDDRARVRARLATKIGVAAAGTALASTPKAAAAFSGAKTAAGAAGAGVTGAGVAGPGVATGGAAAKLSFVAIAKIAAPLLLATAVVTTGPRLVTYDPPTAATTRALARPLETAANVAIERQPPVVPTPVSDVPPRTLEHATPLAIDATRALEVSAEEIALVGAIDAALRSGDAHRATALADEHAHRFPRGILAEEREGARVLARCSAGERGAASGMPSFLAAHPRSPLRARILAECAAKDP